MTPGFKAFLVSLSGALFALLLLALMLSGCAAPQKAEPEGVVIPPEVIAQCKAEGGCTLISRKRLEQELEKFCRGSV